MTTKAIETEILGRKVSVERLDTGFKIAGSQPHHLIAVIYGVLGTEQPVRSESYIITDQLLGSHRALNEITRELDKATQTNMDQCLPSTSAPTTAAAVTATPAQTLAGSRSALPSQ